MQESDLCPQCGADQSGYCQGGQVPLFCHACQLPLRLVAGKYRVMRKLSEGGCGMIYEAEHVSLTRDVRRVVKLLKPSLTRQEQAKARFVREVQVTSALSLENPHIVRIFDDFGEFEGQGFFYVMEFLEGQPLSEMLGALPGGLPLDLVEGLFGQLCDAMQSAHREGIVHRDLKPDNLLVVQRRKEPYFLKVIDFGIAKPLRNTQEAQRLTGGVIGTPMYMAPEQCMGKAIDERADIYAMGCILFEMLTGVAPFSARTLGVQSEPGLVELFACHLSSPVPTLHDILPDGKDVPTAVNEVIRIAMAKEKEGRFASVEALSRAFLSALGKAPAPIAATESGSGSLGLPVTEARISLSEGCEEGGQWQPGRATQEAINALHPARSSTGWVVWGSLLFLCALVLGWWFFQSSSGQQHRHAASLAGSLKTQIPRPVARQKPVLRPVVRRRLVRTRSVFVRPVAMKRTRKLVVKTRRRRPSVRRVVLRVVSKRRVRKRVQVGWCASRPKHGVWLGLRMQAAYRSLRTKWSQGTGRVWREKGHLCVWTSSRQARLKLFLPGVYYECDVRVGGRTKHRYQIVMKPENAIVPSLDYCLK